MKLQQLRYFVAVYEVGSITGGAARTHATQSGLSMQIKDLEYQLNGSLFERSANGVIPTEMGRRFYIHATQILRSVNEATQEMRAIGEKLTGTVHAGLIPTFTRSILPATLTAMSSNYPLVETKVLEAYSDQLTQDVAQGMLDFAIVPAPTSGEELRTRNEYLGTDQEFLVSASDAQTQHMQPINLNKSGPYKLVLPGPANARRHRIDAYIQTHNIEVSQILELDSMLGTLELVASSDWKTILPGLVCLNDRQGDVRKLNPIVGSPLHVDYVMIEPKSSSLSNQSKIFANLLKKELHSKINWHKE
ncbi:MAG: LysR family transcriptional regulator, partial [Planktomarina sp.]|nr:LysR family transcriptional regulator [Porticoccaceae bacterium]MDS9948022.1 LysR family transcriptional regulator [Planktomarina sp.]|tara:strand:+ start:1291 stop:2205 length:915 start_codon:yes stop_codon:yes gene_type:complete